MLLGDCLGSLYFRSNLKAIMSAENVTKEGLLQPTTLQEAINIIKFLNISHKQEVEKLKESYAKQAELVKKLESNRKKELEFLSNELQKYEVNLALRTESVAEQLAQKDLIIKKQAETIAELNEKLKLHSSFNVSGPEINVLLVDSNSDSGVVLENEESPVKRNDTKNETEKVKGTRKCSRRFGDTISFLRRVDFSPMKYKPSNRDGGKKKDEKKNKLQVPPQDKSVSEHRYSNIKCSSDDERRVLDESILSDSIEPLIIRSKKLNDSMNNHFSDDGSEDTSEEIFDRVMTRSSVRRSVKANPKYKKINRSKSKLLDQVKVHIID